MADELLSAQSEPSDSEIEDLLIAAQTGSGSPEWRKLLGNAKLGTFLRVGVEAMLDSDKVDTRKALDLVLGTSVEWKNPTVTNLEEDMEVDMFVGNATETDGIVRFDAEFRIRYTDNDVSWGTASPRLTLPVSSSNPSRVVGTGFGYGGSECKYFHLFSEDVVAEEAVTYSGSTHTNRGLVIEDGDAVGTDRFDGATTDGDGTVYLAWREYIYTLDINSSEFTQYFGPVNPNPSTYPRERNVIALAWHDDTLYAVVSNTLYSVTATGSTRIGNIHSFASIRDNNGLASHDGELYWTGRTPNGSSPYGFGTIDTSTGALTNVLQADDRNRLTVAPIRRDFPTLFSYDGSLYGINLSGQEAIYEFTNLSTGYARSLYEIPLDVAKSATFFVSDRLYFAGNTLHSVDFSSRLISSVDFGVKRIRRRSGRSRNMGV